MRTEGISVDWTMELMELLELYKSVGSLRPHPVDATSHASLWYKSPATWLTGQNFWKKPVAFVNLYRQLSSTRGRLGFCSLASEVGCSGLVLFIFSFYPLRPDISTSPLSRSTRSIYKGPSAIHVYGCGLVDTVIDGTLSLLVIWYHSQEVLDSPPVWAQPVRIV